MIKYKIYTKGSMFYLVDINDTNKIYEAHAKDVLIKKFEEDSVVFFINNLSNWDSLIEIDPLEVEDADSVAYTVESFVTFIESNTGFSQASGSGAGLSKLVGVETVTPTEPPYTPEVVDTGYVENIAVNVNVDVNLIVVDLGTIGFYKLKSLTGINLYTVISGIVSSVVTEYVSAIGERLLLRRRGNDCYIIVL